MRIFLNDRIVEFVASPTPGVLSTDMVVTCESTWKLAEAWADFERYEKFRKFIVIEPSGGSAGASRPGDQPECFSAFSAGFRAFAGMFRYVPAAGGLVKNEMGEYLFIHRFGFWDLPKGKIDRKDAEADPAGIHGLAAAHHAAMREVREETGLKSMTITGALPPTWHIYTEKGKKILKQTSWFEMSADSSQVLKPRTSEGIFLAKWTSPAAIHCILTHTYASIRELLLEIVF
jgi:hypothetical protein